MVLPSGEHVRELPRRACLVLSWQRLGVRVTFMRFPALILEDVGVHVVFVGVRTEGHGCFTQRTCKHVSTRHGIKAALNFGGVILLFTVHHDVLRVSVLEVQASESYAQLYAVHFLVRPLKTFVRPSNGFSHGLKCLDGVRSNVSVYS